MNLRVFFVQSPRFPSTQDFQQHFFFLKGYTYHGDRKSVGFSRMIEMETFRKIFRYLANLEWTEKKQHYCIFCDRENLRSVVYEV